MKLTSNEKVILTTIGTIVLIVLVYNWFGSHFCSGCAIPVKCTGGC